MPKARRDRVVHLTQTRKKGRAHKEALLAKVRSEDWTDRDWDNAVVRIFWELR